MTLTLPNHQVHPQRFKVMSVTAAGTTTPSVSIGGLGCNGNRNAEAKSWGNRKPKRNWSKTFGKK